MKSLKKLRERNCELTSEEGGLELVRVKNSDAHRRSDNEASVVLVEVDRVNFFLSFHIIKFI